MTELKDIEDIFIDKTIIPENQDVFIDDDDVKITKYERVRNDKLKLLVEDKQGNKGFAYINALNDQGRGILNDIAPIIESTFEKQKVHVLFYVLPKFDLDKLKPKYY